MLHYYSGPLFYFLYAHVVCANKLLDLEGLSALLAVGIVADVQFVSECVGIQEAWLLCLQSFAEFLFY